MEGLPLRRVLEFVCAQADVEGARLGNRATDGVITVSTMEDLSRQTVTCVCDVRDLVVADHDLRERIERLLKGVREESDTPEIATLWRDKRDADSVDSLIRAIEGVVEPDSWRDAGGMVGTVREAADYHADAGEPGSDQRFC